MWRQKFPVLYHREHIIPKRESINSLILLNQCNKDVTVNVSIDSYNTVISSMGSTQYREKN